MPKKLTTDEFLVKSKKAHGNRYIYTGTKYIDKYTKVNIECRVHGVFTSFPQSHYKGSNCPQCAKKTEIRSKGLVFTGTGKHKGRATFKAFCKKFGTSFYTQLKLKHGNFYRYRENYYSKCKETDKIPITCPKHGVFWMTPKAHSVGQGCPKCSVNGFKKDKPAILYYLSINNGEAYKIGITNNTVTIRFSAEELKLIKVIATWDYDIGNDAYIKEQQILSKYKKYQYKGDSMLVNGNTELFTKDVLKLDNKLLNQYLHQCVS